jgi:hypothetical protein
MVWLVPIALVMSHRHKRGHHQNANLGWMHWWCVACDRERTNQKELKKQRRTMEEQAI